MNSKRYFSESDKQKARKNTFILIGTTGNGKSQIIKYLTGDPAAKVSKNKNSCTLYSSLYYGAIQNDANNEELFCMIDTPGLCDSSGSNQDKINYSDIKNTLINNKCEVKGIFIIENFQEERMNGEERKVIRAASDLFPLQKFWSYITIIFTHYYNKGSTNKVKIKKEQIGSFCDSLKTIMNEVKERIQTIDCIDVNSIDKIYIDINDDVIEKKGFDLNNEEENELYELGLKDLEKAKKELHTEILKRIKLDPLYDEVRDQGTKRFIIRKDVDTFNYIIYEVFIEIRNFYLKKKLIFTDFIYVKDPEFKEKINKAKFYLEKIGKGFLMTTFVVESPIIKGVFLLYDKRIEIIPALANLYEQMFPD